MCVYSSICQKKGLSVRRYCYYMFYTHALFQSLSGGLLNDTGGLLTLYIMINSLVPLWKVSYIFSSFYNNLGLLHKMIPFFWWNFDNNFHSAQVSSFLDFWLFTDGRKIGPERIANAIKSQSFSSDYVYLLYYCHCFFSDCQFAKILQENTLVHW